MSEMIACYHCARNCTHTIHFVLSFPFIHLHSVKSVVYFDIRCKEEQLSQGMLQMELGLLTAKATPYAAMEDKKDASSSEKDQDTKLDALV